MNHHLPPEWHPQQVVLLSFPRRGGDYGELSIPTARQHLDLCATICQYTPVILVLSDQKLFNQVWTERNEKEVRGPENIRFDRIIYAFRYPLYLVYLDTNDVWARDFGPITIIENGRATVCDFTFNGWGEKYPAELDNAVTRGLVARAILYGAQYNPLPLVLEGGSIESDGAGTVMSTSKCLFHTRRNSHHSREELIMLLKRFLGIRQLLLLDYGHLENDDTDGHIDTLARFAPGNVIVYQACDDPDDEHYNEFQRMAQQLATFKNTEGVNYELLPLPWPSPVYSQEDRRRLPASYANFLITNGAVIVPAIDKKSDPEAVAVLQRAFPDRSIVLQSADFLLEQHGSIHCLTMQIPAIPGCPVVPSV
ncbi:agmatine deiminase [Lewinellaceae bacterium SD302]|nr:agmatine deiminase [Lewinellaceae bacterium SD302]